MSTWNHRQCGDCWMKAHPYEEGAQVQVPHQIIGLPSGTCCFCGNKSQLGIFVRHDPKKLSCTHKPEDE